MGRFHDPGTTAKVAGQTIRHKIKYDFVIFDI